MYKTILIFFNKIRQYKKHLYSLEYVYQDVPTGIVSAEINVAGEKRY